MISYDMIIAELEKQLQEAKHTQSEQKKREALSAIKALCDVALQSNTTAQTPSIQPMMTAALSPVMQQSTTVISPTQVKKLHEEDANGDSLFDF